MSDSDSGSISNWQASPATWRSFWPSTLVAASASSEELELVVELELSEEFWEDMIVATDAATVPWNQTFQKYKVFRT